MREIVDLQASSSVTAALRMHHEACMPCRIAKAVALPEERFWVELTAMCPVGSVLYRKWWESCYARAYPFTLEAALEISVPME